MHEKTLKLLQDCLTPIEYTPKRVHTKEEPREVKYLVKNGYVNRHTKRRDDKLASFTSAPTSKIVQAAKEGRIGLKHQHSLAMSYFIDKKKKV